MRWLCLVSLWALALRSVAQEPAALVIELEHSVDGAAFSARSKFTVTLSAEGKYAVSDLENNQISGAAAEGFKNLLRQNDIYRIRTRAVPGNSSSSYVSAALHACELQKSGFKEDLSIFLGANRNIVGLSYSSPVIALSRSCDAEKLVSPTMLMTRIKASEGETSMTVPVLAQGPKPHTLAMVDVGAFLDDNLKMHGEKGQQAQGNQSFLRRYVSSLSAASLPILLPLHAPIDVHLKLTPHSSSHPTFAQWYIVVFLLIYFFMSDGGGEPSSGAEGGEGAGGAKRQKKD